MIAEAITGFGVAGLGVWGWRTWRRRREQVQAVVPEPVPGLWPARYRVMADMSDEEMATSPLLLLRRYHVVCCMSGENGFSMATVLSPHYDSEERARRDLVHHREHYPSATVVPLVLAFDPEDSFAVDAFIRMLEKAGEAQEGGAP